MPENCESPKKRTEATPEVKPMSIPDAAPIACGARSWALKIMCGKLA